MERTFPQKVKPVPSCEVEDGVMASQIRQAPLEVNRRVRTSAAMIGLAISMGAYSLPLPNQSDEAMAAEPVVGEPAANALPSEFNVAAASPKAAISNLSSIAPPSDVIEHTVQEGQTLWQLAQYYQVRAVDVAAANSISVDAVLHVGQILKIPTRGQAVSLVDAGNAAGNLPGYYGPVEETTPVVSADAVSINPVSTNATHLKAQHDAALEVLNQKRETLRSSLALLKTDRQLKADAQGSAQPEATVASAATPSPAVGAVYQVAPGDTLGAIASAHNVSLRQLVKANHLTNPNVLNVNQVLMIPQTDVAASSAPSFKAASLNVPVIVASADPDRITLPKSVRPSEATATQPALKQAAIAPLAARSSLAEPSVPAVSLNRSATTSPAIGGGTEVATAGLLRGSQSVDTDRSDANAKYSYVESLRLEIVKLREKYQDSANRVQPTSLTGTKVAAASLNVASPATVESSSTAVNPEFKPTRYTQALQEQIRTLQANRQQKSQKAEMQAAAADLAPVSTQAQPQLVATASIGSQSYEPLIPTSVGQMVSPDLPPLGSVDAYLPGNTGKFNGYIWPAKGVLTSGFGYRWGRMHKGIDIAAPVGTPVMAAASGVIITAGWNSGGYGNMVEIQHPDGSVTLYAHNSRILVREGQEVTQGQQIAEMGSTGYSTGPHSHFEVHLPGQGAVNPMAHLPRAQA